jgi:hypothetical protein
VSFGHERTAADEWNQPGPSTRVVTYTGGRQEEFGSAEYAQVGNLTVVGSETGAAAEASTVEAAKRKRKNRPGKNTREYVKRKAGDGVSASQRGRSDEELESEGNRVQAEAGSDGAAMENCDVGGNGVRIIGVGTGDVVVHDLREKLTHQRAEQLAQENIVCTVENENAVSSTGVGTPPVNPRSLMTTVGGESFCIQCNTTKCYHSDELNYEPDSDNDTCDDAVEEVRAFLEGGEELEMSD